MKDIVEICWHGRGGRCRQDLGLLTKAKILLEPTVVPAE